MTSLRYLLAVIFIVAFVNNGAAQCCAGGAGSPIAGGASQGVLAKNQLEINSNYQFITADRFQHGDSRDTNYFESFTSRYIYMRLAYGVTERLTMSVESGYFISKVQVEHGNRDTIRSGGIGDLILFPRYNIWKRKTETCATELTIGLGFKIPVGMYNDSAAHIEPFSGTTYYIPKPLSVQPSTGANDLIFYTFFYKGYKCDLIRFFANGLYIRKGWNPNGEKTGDFASVGLFAGKTFRYRLNATVNLRGEWIGKTQVNEDIMMYTALNYDPLATGSRKLFGGVQCGYNPLEGMMIYIAGEFPLYQYVNRSQIVTKYQITGGISYRLNCGKK